MYVIISHDVDHLYAKDHWFRDLCYPKLWIRSTIQLLRRTIKFKEWWLRCISCFQLKRNHIEEIINFDRENGVPSTFFFGMNKGLGLSYKPEEAREIILNTYKAGFDVGVHGICYDSVEGIEKEYNQFKKTTGLVPCGIRMHYVRFNDNTFEYESNAGYAFDSSEFNKETNGTRKDPYIINGMWEFPLSIMDGYLPEQLDSMKEATIRLLKECEDKNMSYVTILFHDCYFCKAYMNLYEWYIWLISYFVQNEKYQFVSFAKAIKILSNEFQYL